MGAAAGAAKTLGQLQYDVDVRVVVHRDGAAAARAFGGDLPKLDFCHKLRGVYWTINLEIKTQPWVGGTSLLLVFGPFGVMRRKPELKSRCIETLSRAAPLRRQHLH